MLGFFSKENADNVKVKAKEILFVSCSDKLSVDEIRILFSQKAKLFAEKFNLNKVFLHFGKEKIIYDFKV